MPNHKKSNSSDWKLLLLFARFLNPYKKWVWFSLAAIPFTTGAAVLVPYLIVHIVDDYIMPGNISGLYLMAMLLAITVLLGYLADGVYSFSLQKSGQMAISQLRRSLFSHTLSLPRKYFDQKPIGVTLSRLTSDTEAMGESIAIGVLSLITDFIKTVSLFGFLLYLNWQLTLIVAAVLPIVYFVVSFLRKKLRFYFNAARESIAEATAYLQECLNGIKTIQLYAAEVKVVQRFKQKNKKFLKSQTRSNFFDATLFSTIEGITSITMAVIVWYGTGQILSGLVTIGVLIGFINTLSRIFIPIREFAQQISLIQRALSALEHISELFDEKSDEIENQLTKKQEAQLSHFEEIEFRNVTFKYSNDGNAVLKNISFKLKKGEKIAIVGATGAGKSTILRLLTKTYHDYEGDITLNGINLLEIPQNVLYKNISLMLQDVFLFNASIRFNIALKRPEIDEAEINRVIQYVHAKDFIDQLPGKSNFQILDNGSNLSAGQAQLLSFARAIAGNRELILLDEATSSVDSVTESKIQYAIENIFRDKTVIAIAHRLSTIQKSDKIIVLKDGEIIEAGNHLELIKMNGYYVQLLNDINEND